MDHDGTSESHRLNSMLGYVRPYWIPDEETDSCMYCDQKFTLVRRRHHCRACGKILCAFCCNKKMILPSMNFKMSRVCLACYHLLENDKDFSILSNLYSDENLNTKMNGIHPDPTKPEQYCSTIPPFMQAKNTANNIPVVYVPTSILKNGKSNSNKVYNHTIEHGFLTSNSDIETAQSAETQLFEANVTVNGDGSENQQQHRKDTTAKKSVIFADGIRPGGDLSLESDNSFKYSSTSSSSNLFRKKHLISSSSSLSSSSGKARQASIMVIPAVAHIPPAILKFVTPSNNLLFSPQQASDDNSKTNVTEPSHDRWISPTCTLFICSNLRLISHLSYECSTHMAQYLHLRTNGMKGVGMSELSCIIDLSANQNYASKESLESIIYDFGYQFYRIYVDSLHGKNFSALDYISMYKRGPPLQNTNSSESNSQSSSSAELSSSSNINTLSSSSTNMRNSFLYDSCMSGFLLINLPHPSFVQANTNYRSLVCEHFYHYSSNVSNSNNNINDSKECLNNANAKMFHTKTPNMYIEPPRLYSLLIHKWEVSWAHLLPARLLYRLGYEFSYFPYPIVSSLDRKSTFFELNHTIMNLLADCKNFKYTLTRISGLNILYDPKNSSIRILIQNQELEDIDSLITSFRISDHVLAFASDICRPPANSVHACIQHDEDFDVLSNTTTNYSNGIMAGDNGNFLPKNDKFDNDDLKHQHTLHVCCENDNTFTSHNEQKVITLDQNNKTLINGVNNVLSAPEIGGIHQSFVRKVFTNTENTIIEKDDLVINATFIVFNGSLKTHPNPAMKSSSSKPKLTPNTTNISNQTHFENDTFETKNITKNSMFIEDDIKITQVEDGLMVHVNPNTITEITQALTKRIDFIIGSKPIKNTVINVTKKSPNTSLKADILPKNETSKPIPSQKSIVDVDSLSLPPNTTNSPHLNELMQAFSITNTTLESPQWSYDDDYYVENSFQNYCNKPKMEKESKKDTNTNVNLQAMRLNKLQMQLH